MNNNKNNKVNIVQSPIDLNTRFCRRCNLQLVPSKNDIGVYCCPQCACSTTLKDTYPKTSLRPTFPTFSQTDIPNKKHVLQAEDQKLTRSQYYIKKRMEEKNKDEEQDPHLKILRSRSDLHITNVEYYSYDSEEEYPY